MAVGPINVPNFGSFTPDVTPTLAGLVNTINTGMEKERRARTLSELGNMQNGQIDVRPLLSSGDMTLAQLGVNIMNNQTTQARDARNFAWQQQESQRAQFNANRSYGLQARAADRADEDQFVIQKVEAPDGTTSLVRVPKRGATGIIDTGTPQQAGGNPFSPGKFNEGQGKAAGFTDRMLQSEGILSGIGGAGGVQDQGTNALQAGLSAVPGVGNFLISKDRQKFEQAKRDFVNAQLRRESGAAISPSEFESANKQYFPMPGDSSEVIQQKAANRRAAVEAMGREGGPSYRPKYSFDQSGHLAEYRPQQRQQGITQEQYNALPSGTPYTAPDGSQRVKR